MFPTDCLHQAAHLHQSIDILHWFDDRDCVRVRRRAKMPVLSVVGRRARLQCLRCAQPSVCCSQPVRLRATDFQILRTHSHAYTYTQRWLRIADAIVHVKHVFAAHVSASRTIRH